jgi:inosose dehydratase
MTLRIANAPISWGVQTADDASNPTWERVLDEATAAGYNFIELGPLGFMPLDVAVLQPALSARSLAVPGGFLYEDLHRPEAGNYVMSRAAAVVAALQALGASYLIVIDAMSTERMRTAGRSAAAARLGHAAWEHVTELVERIAVLADAHGLKAVLHPHVGTYVEFEDEIAQLLEATDSQKVGLCVDTGHSAYAGVDPVALIDRYGHRVTYLHLKDVSGRVLERVHAEALDFETALAAEIFCPLGRGVVDFVALRGTLAGLGYDGYATVEQDIDLAAATQPAVAAAESLSYLRSVGLA